MFTLQADAHACVAALAVEKVDPKPLAHAAHVAVGAVINVLFGSVVIKFALATKVARERFSASFVPTALRDWLLFATVHAQNAARGVTIKLV